jgi:hypothetical protein
MYDDSAHIAIVMDGPLFFFSLNVAQAPLFCARCQVPPYPQEIVFSFFFLHSTSFSTHILRIVYYKATIL